jgi:opacity protein-like surface antigen
MRMSLAVAALMVGLVSPARAGVTVTIDPGAGSQFAAQAGVPISQIEGQLRMELENLFQTYRLNDYVKSFGDAQAFTSRGLGVDYGSTIGLIEVGIAANLAVNGNKAIVEGDTRTQPVFGVAPNITAMAGLNLGFLGLRPVTLFGNYFKIKGSYREFGTDLDNYGAHVMLKLFTPRRETLWSAFLQWGGIALTTGFDHGRSRLTLNKDFARDIPVGDGTQELGRVSVDSQGTLFFETRTWSIPLELTTNFRFLYVLGAYGGLGVDFQIDGRSDFNVDLTGNLAGTARGQSAALNLGTAHVVVTDSAKPRAGQVRGILGLQMNVWFIKLFTQLNIVPNPLLASVAVGARLVW